MRPRLYDFEYDGLSHFPNVCSTPELHSIEAALEDVAKDVAGVRLFGIAALTLPLSTIGCVGKIAESLIGNAARPVRAILFDKTETSNWNLGWHQDRTIVVRNRVEVSGFGPWTIKAGVQHVAPPPRY